MGTDTGVFPSPVPNKVQTALNLEDFNMPVIFLAEAIPQTAAWGPKVAIVMILCNVLAIALGKQTMGSPNEGPALPSPEMFGGMNAAGLLATTSLGHIIGMGTILGLAAMGLL
ncbi:MAG: photosystem I reaction center subunit PsaK [Prochlorothrix sp.]|nr:photosystem I reaction center subunit PsaK [Prochlorothrix sp.]